jgi:prepilin-type processing-associated H-X9-DG protein
VKPTLRRAAGPLLAAILALLLWPPAPAAAHGGAKITVNHDGRGSVWVNVTYADGHPAEGTIDATLTAKEADGTAIAPAKLVQSSAPGTLVYMSTLPAGTWNVTVEFGPPIARTCTAAFQVGTTNNTQHSDCDAPTPLAASAPPAEDDAGGGNGTAWLLIAVAAAGVLVVAILALTLRRRREAERAEAAAAAARRKPKATAKR